MDMVDRARLICAASELLDGGRGGRFSVLREDKTLPAFVVRYGGGVHAYLNQCAHISVELDWAEGEFFESSGLYLMCTTHGATYEPDTGFCVSGPCKGRRLTALAVVEQDGNVYLTDEELNHG